METGQETIHPGEFDMIQPNSIVTYLIVGLYCLPLVVVIAASYIANRERDEIRRQDEANKR